MQVELTAAQRSCEMLMAMMAEQETEAKRALQGLEAKQAAKEAEMTAMCSDLEVSVCVGIVL
jgi:hypothetical protein